MLSVMLNEAEASTCRVARLRANIDTSGACAQQHSQNTQVKFRKIGDDGSPYTLGMRHVLPT
jgi:hypothetical protein